MQRRINGCVRVFNGALAAVLAAGAGSGVAWRAGSEPGMLACNAAIVAAGLLAVAARLRLWTLHRRLRRIDFTAGVGYYTLDQLFDRGLRAR